VANEKLTLPGGESRGSMLDMRRLRATRVIRRAVVLHLSTSASVLLSCGGQTSPSLVGEEAGTSTGDASEGVPIEESAEEGGTSTDGATGGVPIVESAREGGKPGDGTWEVEASAGDAREVEAPADAAVCQVSSTMAIGGGCGTADFALDGTAAECGATDAGDLPLDRCVALCPPMPGAPPGPAIASCYIYDCIDCAVGPTTIPALACNYAQICGTGRRPAGLGACRPRRAPGAVAEFLAHMAYLEAASVDAFARLERELEAHGAPHDLLVAVRRARRDEVGHARVVKALAERAGADVPSPQVPAGRVRELEDIAIDNAVEGCVHETFGAAVAMVQAATAGDRSVRAAMQTIARDELRHAELSWSIAHWLDRRLDAAARARVRQARHDAGRELLRTTSPEPPQKLVDELGIPTTGHARAIARDLRAALWS
jgi:hypothetical protein